MNPIYTGKDVSYADTKQAQRAAEVACLDGERLATLAWLAGAPYPAESLDKAWRQLSYGAHHDAITGTEGDQVYLDLLAGWREAWERGNDARGAAIRHLAGAASPASSLVSPAGSVGGEATDGERPVSVFNTLATSRSGLTRTTLTFPAPGPEETSTGETSTSQTSTGETSIAQIVLTGPDGEPVPFLAEGARRHPDGSLAELTVTFRATDVPAVGYRAFRATREPAGPAASPTGQTGQTGQATASGWAAIPGLSIENDTFQVTADPERGGTLATIVDKRTGVSLLRGPGNEAELAHEHPAHPRWGEGPWHLSPNGTRTGSAHGPARVRAERCPVGSRLVAEFDLDGLAVTQETVLWDGEPRVEFRTHVDGSIGQDRMLRIRFPADVPGGLPLYETATAVIGRPFGHPDVDTAEHAWTLDNPAHDWFGLGSTGWR
jgi:alpha-mannosidase